MKVKKLVASLTAASCLSGVITVFPEMLQRTYAADIVSNDFESSYEGWYGNNDNVELTANFGAGTDSSRGMKVSGRLSESDGAASSKGLYLFGGDEYTYSVKVYSNQFEKFHFSLLTIDEETGKETTVELASEIVPGGQWTELKNTYTAPKGSYEFKLTITTESANDFYFDDFKITGDKAANEAHAIPSGKGLKDEFGAYFRVGNILNGSTVNNSGITGLILKDHNAIECENETKPDATIVQNGSTDTNVKVSLSRCAAICDFAEKNGLAFRGHTLVWHSQTPEWFFKTNFSDSGSYVNSSTMDKRMESYIQNMFNAYATQYPNLELYAYDVCNEVINDGTASQGGLRPTNDTNGRNGSSAWVRVYGNNSFVEKAFTYARKYAPKSCKLYYNDYNEYAGDKKSCIINTILKPLKAKGLIDGMGMQSHVSAAAGQYDWGGTPSYLAAMDEYLNLGLDVQVTELDISTEGGKYSLDQQATKYKAIFQHAKEWNEKHPNGPNVTLVQVWGPNDNNSWVATDKQSGRSNQPLLYNGSNQPKSAYNAIASIIPDSQWTIGKPYTGPGSSGFTVKDPEPDENGYWFHDTFESGEANWSGRGSAKVASSSSAKYQGSKSLFCSGREASWNGAAMPLNSRIFQPGKEYSFSVNAMTTEGDDVTEFKFTLQYNDAAGEAQYVEIAKASAPKGEWVQLANTNYKLPSDASDMIIYVETTDEEKYVDFFIDDAVGAPAGTVVPGAGQPKVRKVILGDINFDERIDSLDMIAARKGIIKGSFADSMTEKAADVDQNKAFEVADLVLLQEFILGKITEFPINKPATPQVDLSAMAVKFGNVSLADSYKKDNENNPIYTQRFGADPGWMVYDGRLYVYTTADEFQYKNGQMIENDYASGAINCLSTADLVNWTDHGQIPVAKTHVNNPIAKWANNAWAPDAAWKKINGQDKFFLYFANNGSGIGVITADDPTFTKNVKDPLGHELISRSTPNSNVTWLFDPGVYYDPTTDTGIIAYGGGVPSGQAANTKQGRIAKLGSDMISIVGTPIDPGTPYLFEDSSMIKIGNTWYYSFCHNWNVPGGTSVNGNSFGNADIGYMTSTDPLKGYTYQGVVFKNTGTQRLDNGGNNHHSIIEFKGNYYVLYHSRQLEMRMGVNGGKGLNYRSPCIDKATLSNGKITCNGSQGGVSQLENLDPTQTVRAATMSNQSKGISVSGVGNSTLNLKKGEWAKVSKVDFSKVDGTLTAKASSKNGAMIKVCAGSRTGDAIAYIEVPAGGSVSEIITGIPNVPNGASDIYFIANGDVSFDSWSMS